MIKKLGTLALTFVLMITLALAGCANKTADVSTEKNKTREDINIRLKTNVDSLDPQLSSNDYSSNAILNMYNTLVISDSKNNILPCLAKSWEISDDGLTYTFFIEENVKFHNNKKLTAEDVKFTLDRALTVPMGSTYAFMINRTDIINEHTVKVTLKEPYAPFMEYLVLPFYAILNKEAVTAANGDKFANPVGTGPFKFVEYKDGEYLSMTRNDDYFKTPAKIKDVKFKIIIDQTTMTMALEKGEIDFLEELPGAERERFKKDKRFEVLEYPTNYLHYFMLNPNIEPLKDKRVRQAIGYAIDLEAAKKVVYDGAGEVNYTILRSDMFGYSDNIPRYTYNPEKAKELLKEAGYANGFNLKFVSVDTVAGRKAPQVMQGYLADLGITMEIETNEFGVYAQKITGSDFVISCCATLAQNDPDTLLYQLFYSTEMMNMPKYNNPEVDKLLDLQRKEVNEQKRKEYIKQIMDIVMEDATILPYLYREDAATYPVSLKGVTPKANCIHYIYDFYWD